MMNSSTVICCFLAFVVCCCSAQKETELNNVNSNEPHVEASNGYPSLARSRTRGSNTVEDEYQPMEPYAFGYNVKDDYGNNQYRKEEAGNDGVIKGSYGYTDAAGLYRVVEYIADRLGFRTKIRSNEPGLKSMSSSSVQLEAQDPPESVAAAAAAASAPKEVIAHLKPASLPLTVPSGLNPRFRYVASASELQPQVHPSSSEKQRN